MSFFKIVILTILSFILYNSAIADSHDKKQDIIEKAKEINQQIKKKQANSQANISSEINEEEPLPLNDPFVGDSSLTGGSEVLTNNPEEARNEMSLYNFKLVGIMKGEFVSYVSLINSAGEIITLETYEELSDGVKLVNLSPSEAIFQKEDQTFITINFKNQIKEVNTLN